MDTLQILGKDQALVCALFSVCEVTLPQSRSIILLNATGREQLYLRTSQTGTWQIARFTHDLEPAGEETRTLGDGDAFDIPSGGAAVLKQTRS